MNKILLIIYLFLSLHYYGQKEDRIWYFGGVATNSLTPGAGLDFNSGAPIPLLNSSMGLTEGSATQCNKSGALLFYTNGMQVWDRTHSTMFNGTGLGGHVSAEQAALIIPFPTDTNKYYLFGQDGAPTCPGTGLYYSIIDMNLNNGLGSVTSTKAVHLQNATSEWLAGSKHSNGIDFWVVTTDFDSCIFYSYKISATGVSTRVKTNLGYNTNAYFKLDFNTKGNQISYKAYPSTTSSSFIRYVADFNQSTGIISNPIPLDTSSGNTASGFSPNDSILYAVIYNPTTISTSLNQYNLKSSNIYASKQLIKTFTDAPHLDMKLGPDGKIYLTSSSLDSLDVIKFPNVFGLGCNFQQKALYLGGKHFRYILPNKTFIRSNLILSINEKSSSIFLNIYPNPSDGTIFLQTNISNGKYYISNMMGDIIFERKLDNIITPQAIPTKLFKGIYFILISDLTGNFYRQKIVIE